MTVQITQRFIGSQWVCSFNLNLFHSLIFHQSFTLNINSIISDMLNGNRNGSRLQSKSHKCNLKQGILEGMVDQLNSRMISLEYHKCVDVYLFGFSLLILSRHLNPQKIYLMHSQHTLTLTWMCPTISWSGILKNHRRQL